MVQLRAHGRAGRPRVVQTVIAEVHRLALNDWNALNAQSWPLTHYRDDPVGFVKNVLKEELAPHQADILRAIVTNEKVTVRSGQKCGKTATIVMAALWWYATREGARVIVTAAIGDQIKRVIWNELEIRVGAARKRGLEIEKPGKSPTSGLVAPDGRQIIGFTARDIEAVAGISGPEMLFIVDEASALRQNFAEAIEGNMAGGGCRMVYISNPTRTEGPFYDSFHSKRTQFCCFTLDAEKIAVWNAARKGGPIKGIVDQRKIEQWREEYGPDSVFYRVRVKGDFVQNETGRVLDIATITESQCRHPDASATGTLTIGIDPAGPGDGGDETAFAIVRGQKLLALYTFRSLTEDEIVAHARGFCKQYRDDEETPRIVVDCEGPIGAPLTGKMRGIADVLRRTRPAEAYDAFGVKASTDAKREPHLYEKTRDELWANLAKWMRDGGAIIPDHMLEAELHAPSFESTIGGRLRVTHKNKLRDMLGRSPDRADALALAVWDPAPWLHERVETTPPVNESVGIREDDRARDLDPYEHIGLDAYSR